MGGFKRAAVIGSSGGVGGALARRLADAGAAVHAFSRSGGVTDSRMVGGPIDLLKEKTIAAAAAGLGDDAELDLVIVATGLLHDGALSPEKAFRDLEGPKLARYFAVNTIGPALVAKHFLPLLRRSGTPVFAALSARVGSIGDNRLGGWYGYRASKAALNMTIKTLAIELARTRPNAICVALHPGTVDTPLSKPFQRGVAEGRLFKPEMSAERLLEVVANLRAEDSGSCIGWDGATIVP
ncbi:MAG TPA: SDR family NAD(P)-dependent oxidoreductase [Allosphingosinicella sp.]|jgi:NAD(P)-dependent dehydrogenase (short-subunit alcohol dehydrogenase family)